MEKDKEKETPKTPTIEETFQLSEDEVKSRLAEYAQLKKEQKERSIKDKVKAWQDAKKEPALLVEAEKLLMADEGAVALHLSEGGADQSLTLSHVVERLVNASPEIKLTEEQIREEEQSKEKPNDDTKDENDKANLSAEEKVEVTALMLEDFVPEKDAIARVVAKRDKS